MYSCGIGMPAENASSRTIWWSRGSSSSASGCARLILSAILSENQYETKLIASPIARNIAAGPGPPISAPSATRMPVSGASSIVGRIPAFRLNRVLLRRRFELLEGLLAMMERVDLSRPGRRLQLDTEMPGVSTDIQRLAATFNRMLERLERERQRSGEMVLQAQEEERKRIARDLHDEVNQALTALLLRIEAAVQDAPPALREELAETKRLANRAMDELLDLARQLRPTALDDHGLVAALRTPVREQDRRGPASVG